MADKAIGIKEVHEGIDF